MTVGELRSIIDRLPNDTPVVSAEMSDLWAVVDTHEWGDCHSATVQTVLVITDERGLESV